MKTERSGRRAHAANVSHDDKSSVNGQHSHAPDRSQSATTSPIAETWDKKRFRRDVRSDKVPIRHPESLISLFAKQLGETLAPYAFFERAGRCVLLEYDCKTRVFQLVEAEPYGFRTDIEAIVKPYVERTDEETGKTKRHYKTISLECSRTVLAAKEFLQELRPIYGFSAIRLPYRRPDGKIELLPEGYDATSGILTASANGSSDYIDLSGQLLKLDDAAAYLRSLLSEFCFRAEDKERSISVMIAAMLTMFLRLLLGPRVAKPAFLYTANSEGAGKTLLAKLAIIPMLGLCPTGTLPEDEKELRKLIFALALADESVLFLDNVEGYLKSSALASFLTSPVVQDRILGFSRLLKLEHNAVTFITGNNATYSADLRRRMLSVDLFLEELRAEDRPISQPLDDAKIIARRSDILAALWRLVHNWIEAGQPEARELHQSFLEWSKIVGGILELADFVSPCTPPAVELSGDTDTRDLETLVDKMNPGKEFRYADLIQFCRDYELFGRFIPREGELDAKQYTKFGIVLRRAKDRIMKGRYRFRITGEKRAKIYSVEDLKPGEPHT